HAELARRQGHIALLLTQRRHVDGDGAEPVEQVAAELAPARARTGAPGNLRLSGSMAAPPGAAAAWPGPAAPPGQRWHVAACRRPERDCCVIAARARSG